jgi:hypothetical protein
MSYLLMPRPTGKVRPHKVRIDALRAVHLLTMYAPYVDR